MTLLVTEHDVRTMLAQDDAIGEAMQLIERALVEQAAGRQALHPRIQVDYPVGSAGESEGRCLRLMPCIVPALGVAAIRIYTMNKEGDPSRPAPCELILLFDHPSMTLRTVIEDYSLHTLRTAAPSGVATAWLARPDARRAAVLGSGRHARGQLSAVASVRSLEDVRVYSPDPSHRDAFCAEMGALLDCPVISCASAEAAVEDADVVVTATHTNQPVLRGTWLKPGAHVNSIAPFELDEEAVLRGRLFLSSKEEVIAGTPPWQPIPTLLERGALKPEALQTELADVVTRAAHGRQSEDEITIFISTGMANWDAAIGVWAEQRARRSSLGRELWKSGAPRSLDGLVVPAPTPVRAREPHERERRYPSGLQ